MIKATLARFIEEDAAILQNLQNRLRSPLCDFIFCNFLTLLGTHTMFLIGLPFLFWLGDAAYARHLTIVLGLGVVFTNMIKDFYQLPRPAVRRLLHEEGSTHPFEYGFPSTHSCNSASIVTLVALYFGFDILKIGTLSAGEWAGFLVLLVYALGLPFSRLYCGMHSFSDVIFGTLLGSFTSLAHFYLLAPLLDSVISDPVSSAAILGVDVASLAAVCGSVAFVIIGALLFVWHPKPNDPCPCYDDSICFGGVVIGLVYGVVDYSASLGPGTSASVTGLDKLTLPWSLYPTDSTSPVSDIELKCHVYLSIFGVVARLLMGTGLLMAWRSGMKLIGWPIGTLLCSYLNIPIMSNLKTSLALKLQKEAARTAKVKVSRRSSSVELVTGKSEKLSLIDGSSDSLSEESSPSCCFEQSDKFAMNRVSLEMSLKFLIYIGIGFLSVDLIPRLFCVLEI